MQGVVYVHAVKVCILMRTHVKAAEDLLVGAKQHCIPAGWKHMAQQMPCMREVPPHPHTPPCRHTDKQESLSGTGCC